MSSLIFPIAVSGTVHQGKKVHSPPLPIRHQYATNTPCRRIAQVMLLGKRTLGNIRQVPGMNPEALVSVNIDDIDQEEENMGKQSSSYLTLAFP